MPMDSNKIRNAAILLLGLGEKYASEILKNMNPLEIKKIIAAIDNIDSVSEKDVVRALNDFFRENNSGIDPASKEFVRNSIISAIGSKGMGNLISDNEHDTKHPGFNLLRSQPINTIAEIIKAEHPQVIAAIILVISNTVGSERGSKVIRYLPKPLQNEVIRRMSCIGTMSDYAISVLSTFFQNQLEQSAKYNVVSVDGVDAVANIVFYLDSETERSIMEDLAQTNKDLCEKIQDKILPFAKLVELDKKSLQALLKEISNDDLIMALKGVDERIRDAFMRNMSQKSAEILKEEMETKGPVKLANVVDAQKRIILLAKKMSDEEKIILATKDDPNIVF